MGFQRENKRKEEQMGFAMRAHKEVARVEAQKQGKRRKIGFRAWHTKKGVRLKRDNKRKQEMMGVRAGGIQRKLWGSRKLKKGRGLSLGNRVGFKFENK